MTDQPQDATGGLNDTAARATEDMLASYPPGDPAPPLIKAAARALTAKRWATLQLIAAALEGAEIDTAVLAGARDATIRRAMLESQRREQTPAGEAVGRYGLPE